jgi:hypothetical protein
VVWIFWLIGGLSVAWCVVGWFSARVQAETYERREALSDLLQADLDDTEIAENLHALLRKAGYNERDSSR